MRIRFGVKHDTSNKMKEIMPVDMVEELIPELLAEEEMNDAEIEQLEEIRRFGNPAVADEDDEDEGDYYTLPPSHTEIMRDWTTWRMTVNDLMSDVIQKRNDTETVEAEREILTSTNSSKTPDFFSGNMYIHGQRVKDQYGCKAINETDDNDTKIEKKIIEGNFYLFGIPRISVRQASNECPRSMPSSPVMGSSRLAERRTSDGVLLERQIKDNLSSHCTDLVNTDNLEECDNRPFQGLARARKASFSRKLSVSSGSSSCDSNGNKINSLESLRQKAKRLSRLSQNDIAQTVSSRHSSCHTENTVRALSGLTLNNFAGQNSCVKHISPINTVRSSTLVSVRL